MFLDRTTPNAHHGEKRFEQMNGCFCDHFAIGKKKHIEKGVFWTLKIGGKVVGLVREEKLELPVEAMREALINALCHRLRLIRSSTLLQQRRFGACARLRKIMVLQVSLRRKSQSQ